MTAYLLTQIASLRNNPSLLLLITLVGSILSLLPICLNFDYQLGKSALGHSLRSDACFASCTAIIISCIPTIIDASLDYSTFFLVGGYKLQSNRSQKYLLARTIIATTILAPTCYFFNVISQPNIRDERSSEAETSHTAAIFICIYSIFKIVLFGTTLYSLSLADQAIWTVQRSAVVEILFIAQSVTSTFTVSSADTYQITSILGTILSYLSSGLCVFMILIWLFYRVFAYYECLMYPYRQLEAFVTIKFRRMANYSRRSPADIEGGIGDNISDIGADAPKITPPKAWTAEDHYCLYSILNLIAMTVCGWALWHGYGVQDMDWANENMSAVCISALMYTLVGVIFLCTILPIRYARAELIQSKDALIESKRCYVNYLSHELRTPLNTVFLGLKLVTDDLLDSEDEKDMDRLESLRDVSISCEATLGILNDLLTYDKLENGMLEASMQEKVAMKFILEAARPFAVQAKERGVDFEIRLDEDCLGDATMNSTERMQDQLSLSSTSELGGTMVGAVPHQPSRILDPSTSTDNSLLLSSLLQEDDIVLIDVNKMSQVIRNLISNALKFTPQGGLVTVRVAIRFDHKPSSVNDHRQDAAALIPRRRNVHGLTIFRKEAALKFLQKRSANRDKKVSKENTTHKDLIDDTGLKVKPTPLIRKMLARSFVGCSLLWWKQGQQKRQISSCPLIEADPSIDSDNKAVDAGSHCHSGIYEELYVVGTMSIIVKDSGAGISKSNQKKLFNQYVQFNPGELQAGGGSGLGLWITKGIVDLHGGTIRAVSEGEGRGTSFIVEIPVIRRYDGPASMTNSTAQFSPNRYQSGRCFNESSSVASATSLRDVIAAKAHDHIRMASSLLKSPTMEAQGGGVVGVGIRTRKLEENEEAKPELTSAQQDKCVSTHTSSRRIDPRALMSVEELDAVSSFHDGGVSCTMTDTVSGSTGFGDRVPLHAKPQSSPNNLQPISPQARGGDDTPPDHASSDALLSPQHRHQELLQPHRRSPQQSCYDDMTTKPTTVENRKVGKKKTPVGGGLRILVVDDSDMTRRMVCKVFRAAGHDCDDAEDGLRAIDKVIGTSKEDTVGIYDVILMDFLMPNMDGPTATRELRSQGYKGIIIGVTGNVLPADINHFQRNGATAVLAKPLRIEAFDELIEDILKKNDPGKMSIAGRNS